MKDKTIPGIEKLIPQKPPFVMIDKLLTVGENCASGELTVRSDNILCSEGFLREPALIEFMAQTAAAYTGYRRSILNENISGGYIGLIKDLLISSLPPLNSVIKSEITIENEIIGYTLICAKVRLDDNVIAECGMRILNT